MSLCLPKKHIYSSLEEAKNKDGMNNINADCDSYLEWANQIVWLLEKVRVMISELDSSSTVNKVVFYLRIQGVEKYYCRYSDME